MLCDKCQKRQATVHIKHIGPQGTMEAHLCESCAQEDGNFQLSPQLSFQKFFPQFFSMAEPAANTNLCCKQCGMTLAQLAKNGKPGCSECYATFGDSLRPLLRRIHANSQHTGKAPGKSGEKLRRDKELAALRHDLSLAVKEERFEEAAILRDKIRLWETGTEDVLANKKVKENKGKKSAKEGKPDDKDK